MTARSIRERAEEAIDVERIARLAVDRLVYGRHDACQRIVKAAERMGEAYRFAAAYLTALLTVGDLDDLDIRWSEADLRDQLLVAADRLMAKGNEAGEMLALALGPWSGGDWRGADKYIAHLNAQPRLYNVEAVAGDIFARGMAERAVTPRRAQADALLGQALFGEVALGPWIRDEQETALRMIVRDLDSWRALAHARVHGRLSISDGEVAHVMMRCSVSNWRVEADTRHGLTWIEITLRHDAAKVVDDAWPVAGAKIARWWR